MKNETVFRDKSIERISSPDQLNDYIRLSNPGVWFLLLAIIIILGGACIFGIVGHIDSTVPAVAVAKDGRAKCLVKREYEDRFTDDMQIKIEGEEYEISFEKEPVAVTDGIPAYALYLGKLKRGEWVYEAEVSGSFPDGSYEAKVVTERVSPLSYLFNDQ